MIQDFFRNTTYRKGHDIMQIALTKKLADGLKLKPKPAMEEIDPLFKWTANWITTWDNRRSEDMLVLVNNANRFAVIVYQVKRTDLKNIETIIQNAITNTFATMNIHPDVIEAYMKQAGKIQFIKNSDRKATAWVNKAGQEGSFRVSHEYNGIDNMYDDTIGAIISNIPVNYSKNFKDSYFPNEEMIHALSELTDQSIYNYQAFELLVTLDLNVYKATRRLIVPANISFHKFHTVLQRTFNWKNYHLYDFEILERDGIATTLVPFEENLEFNPTATLMNTQVLSDYLQIHKHMLYRYDFGDNWEHEIELVRVIKNHDKPSPYLLEAVGQTPPEDVGGVSGFNYFREIMLDPNQPEHDEMKNWAGYWNSELYDHQKRPGLI